MSSGGGAWGRGLVEVATASPGHVESFVEIPASQTGLSAVTLHWDLALPVGGRAVQSGPHILLERRDGITLVRISAPLAVSKFGTEIPVTPILDEDGEGFSITVDSTAFGVQGEDLLVDPDFTQVGGGGVAEKLWCVDANYGAAYDCEITESADSTGWFEGNDSGGMFTSWANYSQWYGSTTAGLQIRADVNKSFQQNDNSLYYYDVSDDDNDDAGIRVYTISMNGYLNDDNGNFKCGLRWHETEDASGTWGTGTWITADGTSFNESFTDTNGAWMDKVGFQFLKDSSGNHSSGSTEDAHRCNMRRYPSTGAPTGGMKLTLQDRQTPDSAAPDTVDASPAEEMIYDPTDVDGVSYWHRPGEVVRVGYDVDDDRGVYGQGMGIEEFTLVTAPASGTPTIESSAFNLCTPDETAVRPCPVDPPVGSVTFTVSGSNSTSGKNTIKVKAYDFSNRSTSSAASTYWYDGTAPSNPASWSEAPADNATYVGAASGTVTLDWANGSDPHSGVGGYEVRFGTTSDLSSVNAEQTASSLFEVDLGVASQYYWQVRTLDNVGNAAAWSSVFDFTVDQTPPSATLNSPEDTYSKRASGNDTYAATVSDVGAGVGTVKFQYRLFGASSWADLGVATYNAGTGRREYAADLPGDGLYLVRASATDLASPSANVRTTNPIEVCRDIATMTHPSSVNHEIVGSQAKVWWSVPDNGEAGFIVEREQDGSGTWVKVARVPKLDTTTYDISDPGPLSGGSTYKWRVQSIGQTCTDEPKVSTGTQSAASTTGSSAEDPDEIRRLGAERSWQMYSEPLGAGATALVNVAGGNLVVSKPLTSNRGRGFDTNPVLVYNSQAVVDEPDDLALAGTTGPNWTLSLDALAPGDGIDSFTGISVSAAKISGSQIILQDADGTKHTFTQDYADTYRYNPPTGGEQFLYVRDYAAANSAEGSTIEPMPSPSVSGGKYAATRPDRVTYFYADSDANDPDKNGQLLEIRDRYGNRMIFDYECIAVPDDRDSGSSITRSGQDLCANYTTAPTGTSEVLRLEKITDAGGRDLAFTYADTYSAGQGNLLGRLKTITDHDTTNGKTELAYARVDTVASGKVPLLASITEAHGTSASRTTDIDYVDSDDATTPFEDESRRIGYVEDPRSNKTRIAYTNLDSRGTPRVGAVTDRVDSAGAVGNRTAFSYDLDAGRTTVADELFGVTTYTWAPGTAASSGQVTRAANANGVTVAYDYIGSHGRQVARHEIAPQVIDQPVQLNGIGAVELSDMPIDITQPVTVRSASGGGGTLYQEYNPPTTYDYILTKKASDISTGGLTGTAEVTVADVEVAPGHPIVVTKGQLSSSGSVYAEGRDYTVTSTNPLKIARTSNSRIVSGTGVYVTYWPTATIARHSFSTIGDGSTVYVSYTPIHATWTSLYDFKTGIPVSHTDPGETATVTTITGNSFHGGRVADPYQITTARGTATADPDDFTTTYAYDGSYRLTSITRPINYGTGDAADLATTTYAYYTSGDLKSEQDGRGYYTGYSQYDTSGQPKRVHEKSLSAFNTSGTNSSAPVYDDVTAVDTFAVYDIRGNATCTDDKRETSDNAPGTSGSPDMSDTGACVFGSTNRVFSESTTDPLGRTTTTTEPWDTSRRRASITTYDANDNATSVKDSIGFTPGTTTPASPDSVTPGATTTTTYDEADRTTAVSLPANDLAGTPRIRTIKYDAADRVTEEVEPKGNATIVAHDHSQRRVYDAGGRVVGETDGEGALTCHYYDHYDNETKTTQPMAVSAGTTTCPGAAPSTYVTTTQFDRNHNPVSETNVQGKATTYQYDEDGNKVTETPPGGSSQATNFAYDPTGELLQTTSPAFPICAVADGGDPDSDPDISADQCTTTRTNYRPVSKAEFDKSGNPSKEIDARQAAETGNSSTHAVTIAYNAYNEQTRTSLPKADAGETQLYAHTALNALNEVVATTLQTAEADVSNVPSAEKTTFTYSPGREIESKTDNPNDADVDNYDYDVNGEVSRRTQNGQDTEWAYYPDGSQKTRDNTAGDIPAVTYTYDPSGNAEGINESGSSQDVTYQLYDKAGRALKITGTDGKLVTNTYDRNGNVLTETTGGRVIRYQYGTATGNRDLMTHVEIGRVDSATPQISADFTYDDNGRLATITRNSSPALVTTYSYDNAGHVTQIRTVRGASDVMQDYDYLYDASGNIRKIDKQLRTTGGLSGVQSSAFTYDGQNRVVTDDLPGSDRRRYVFDATGRLDKVLDEDCSSETWVENYTYDDQDADGNDGNEVGQIDTHAVRTLSAAPTCTVTSTSTDTIAYGDGSAGKPRGNITTIDHPTGNDVAYGYDALNRQASVTAGSTTEAVTYDSLDRRATHSDGDQLSDDISYGYVGENSEPTVEVDATLDGGTEARVLLGGPDDMTVGETRLDFTSKRYFLTDHLGSTVASIDATGTVQATIDYDTYGSAGTATLISDTGTETPNTPYQYTGQRTDPLAETTHHGAREYNATLRTWTQTDQYLEPNGDLELSTASGGRSSPGGVNRAQYAGANPVNNVDPTGHYKEQFGASTRNQLITQCYLEVKWRSGSLERGARPGLKMRTACNYGDSGTTCTSSSGGTACRKVSYRITTNYDVFIARISAFGGFLTSETRNPSNTSYSISTKSQRNSWTESGWRYANSNYTCKGTSVKFRFSVDAFGEVVRTNAVTAGGATLTTSGKSQGSSSLDLEESC